MSRPRQTRQRDAILGELRRTCSHPTAVELYELVRRQLPRISLGTVYRNLEVLARAGTIRRIEVSGAETRFDAETRQHYHVRCVRCGRVDDALGLSGDPLREQITRVNGYEILGFRLEFVGICPECQVGPESGGEGANGGGAEFGANWPVSSGTHAADDHRLRSQEGD